MIFRASSCKGALIRKHLSQHWLLFLGIILILLVQVSEILVTVFSTLPADFLGDWAYLIETYAIGTMELISATVISTLVFSYLHQKKRNSFFLSLPTTKDDLFLSSYIGGFLFYVLPWLLTTVISSLCIFHFRTSYPIVFINFVKASIYRLCQFIAFFSFATLGMVLSGRTFFGILTALMIALILPATELLFVSIAEIMLFGVTTTADPVTFLLSPFMLFSPQWGYRESMSVSIWKGVIYASACLLMTYGTMLIHRKRSEERVGQSILFSSLRGIAQWFLTLIFSLLLLAPIGLVAEDLPVYALLITSAIGFFLARMLLLRSRKVFQKKAFISYGIYVVVFTAFLLTFQFDLFGIEKKIPKEEKIREATVSLRDMEYTSQDPEDIQAVLAIHQTVLQHQDSLENAMNASVDDFRTLNINYTLNNRTFQRTYYLYSDDTHADLVITESVEAFLRKDKTVEKQLQKLVAETTSVSFVSDNHDRIYLSTLQQQEFFQLLQQDITSGSDPLFLYNNKWGGDGISVRLDSSSAPTVLYITEEIPNVHNLLKSIEKETPLQKNP